MFLLWDWLDTLYNMAKKIRQTSSWSNYKTYFEKLLNGAHAQHCDIVNPVEEEKAKFCTQLKSRMATINNVAAEHCKRKVKGCRKYCEKFCDHFVDMSTSEYYPSCPTRLEQNNTGEIYPVDNDIDEYLTMFI